MNKFKQGLNRVVKFLKKNIYYVLIIVCIAAIGAMVTVSLTRDKQNSNNTAVVTPDNPQNVDPDDPQDLEEPEEPVQPDPVIFICPVENSTIGMEYNDTELVFSRTLNQWSTHKGIDFLADEESAVVAVCDGYVANIQKDTMNGNVVTINHENGLSTKYYSLGDEIDVEIGQNIIAGTKIGVVSTSMIIESEEGPHLHFEVLENDIIVNPQNYFVTDNK